jgi:predicted metalloprotease
VRGVRARLLALAVTSSCLLTGCFSAVPEDRGALRERAQEVVDAVKDAVEEAKERQAAGSGDVGGRTPTGDAVLRTDTQTAFSYEEYSQTVESVLGSLDEYWTQALPATFGVRYKSPTRYVYYRPEESPGPRCGGEQAPAKNAFYCSAGDFIAWDESGLLIPYYVGSGDFAAAFVLAHEFGHAMQARLPQKERPGILNELQADCFAGAWARYAQEQDFLSEGDLDEATLAVFSARDVPGTEFTDPRAHGSGFERTRAFADGYESGPRRCYPAPAEDWVVREQQP